MAIEPIRSVDDALLAQTWVNAGACRSWLKRRGTTPEALGLIIVDEPAPMVSLRIQQGGPRLGVDPAENPQKPAENSALPDFELWALDVDTLLDAANEPPASDQLLASLLAENLSPEAAVEEIIARRAAELDRSMTDAEAHCPDCRPELVCWGAPDRCEARLQATAAPPIEEGAEHPGVTQIREMRGQLGTEGAGYHVRLASAMTREEALHLAARVSGAFGVGVHVCDAHTGLVIDALVGPDRTAA